MAVITTNISCDLKEVVKVQYLSGNLFSQDNQANVINVTVTDGGEPATISGTVTANIIREDGGTVTATGGTISGNVVSITLPAAAYIVPGLVSIVVKLTASSVVTTLAAIVANVYQSSTETAVDPGTIIPSVTALVSQIETAVASIPADYSALWTSLAPAFSTSATYAPGQYVTNGGTLYVCTAAHTGSWVAGHFAATNLGAGLSDLKSEILDANTAIWKGGSLKLPLVWERGIINASYQEANNTTVGYARTVGYFTPQKNLKIDVSFLFSNSGAFVVVQYSSSGTGESRTAYLKSANPNGLSVTLTAGKKYRFCYTADPSSTTVDYTDIDSYISITSIVLGEAIGVPQLANDTATYLTVNPFIPLAFTDVGYTFNGSSSSSIDSSAKAGFIFDGFDRVASGSGDVYGIAKEIVAPVRPSVLSSGAKKKISFFFKLATGVKKVSGIHIAISTSKGWNNSQDSFINKANVTVFPGWNIVELNVNGTASSETEYKYAIITTTTLANIQNIESVYFYYDDGVTEANRSKFTENATNAGFTFADDEVSPVPATQGTATSGGASWSVGVDGYTHNLAFANGTSSSGNYYGLITWDIKPLFGRGIILDFSITNSNGADSNFSSSNWSFNKFLLTQSQYNWSQTIKTINIANYGGSETKASSSFQINIDEAFSDVTASSYTHIYLFVAAYKSAPSSIPAATLGITLRMILPNYRVFASKLNGFNQNDYYTKTEVDELIEEYSPDVDMLFWGDSLTAGAGGNGTTYPAVCAAELGNLTIKNCGVGGENANTIAARQGGNTLIIPSGNINGNYAYTDFHDVFGGDVRPLRQGEGTAAGSNKLYINGVECSLSISQTSSTSTDAVYTISGYTGGSSAVPLLARFIGSKFTGDIVVIWVGTNGAKVGNDNTITARMSIIDSMISHLPHKKYVIMGLSKGTSSERDAEDQTLLEKYGAKFFPTRKLLVNYGLTINNLTATTQDEEDISAGTVPTSLRYDDVHMNAYGYTAIGKLLADKIRALGYVR